MSKEAPKPDTLKVKKILRVNPSTHELITQHCEELSRELGRRVTLGEAIQIAINDHKTLTRLDRVTGVGGVRERLEDRHPGSSKRPDVASSS